MLIYLRIRKYNMAETFKVIETTYAARIKYKNFWDFGDKNFEKMSSLYETGCFVPLPERNDEGQKIVLYRFSKWNPEKFTPHDFLRLVLYNCSILIEEEETQIAGVVTIIDCADLTSNHLVSPMFLKELAAVGKDLQSIRYKTSYLMNLPPFAKLIVDLFIKLLSEKIGMRIKTLENPDDLKKHVEPSLLPKEYGGTSMTCVEMMQKFSAFEKERRTSNLYGWRYGSDWDKSTLNLFESAVEDENVGSFRKLDID